MAATITLAIKQNSQNITNNTSSVTVDVTVKWTYGSWNATGECYGSITIDGTKYSFTGIKFNTNATTSGSQVIMTKTVNVSHNADGTKTLACSASFYTGLKSSGTPTASATRTLTTIPRATTPTLSASSVDMGSTVTINTPRASSSFTHDLAYSFNGAGYVSIATGVGTSYSWTVPDKATSIPNATSGTMTVRCITKSGSTTIGTKTVTLTAKVPTSVVPTISAVSLAEAVSGLAAQFGAYVKNKSKVTATITAAGAKGSTIKSYSTTFYGATYTGSTWTSALLTSSGTLSMTTTVTDSRGRTAKKSTTLSVLDYYLPEITKLRVYRADGDQYDPDPEGTYMAVELAYAVAPVGGGNTAELVLEVKKATDTDWVELDNMTSPELAERFIYGGYGDNLDEPFSVDYQYDVRATLTDWFGAKTVYTAIPLPSGEVILDISADGKGISFGTTSDRLGVLFGWPVKGQVFGLGEATAVLPEQADLNDYHMPGIYSTKDNATTKTLVNCPSIYAGTLRVYNALGNSKHDGAYVYIIQEYRSYWVSEPTYRRLLQTGEDGAWSAGDWVSQ